MQCETYLFGRVDIDADSVISFPSGIPGFSSQRFALIHDADAEAPASFTLQSLDEPSVALQIADPTVFGLRYDVQLSPEEVTLLKSEDTTDVALMLVLFRQEDQQAPIAANLQAPLLINTRTRIGVQRIIATLSPRETLSKLSTPA